MGTATVTATRTTRTTPRSTAARCGRRRTPPAGSGTPTAATRWATVSPSRRRRCPPSAAPGASGRAWAASAPSDGERDPPVRPTAAAAGRAHLHPEALDAMVCAREPGMLRDKEQLRSALRVALVKDRRDEEVFDEIFDQFFALVKVGGPGVGHGHGHGHDDLSDEGALEDFTLSDTPSDTPQEGHSHGKPVDIRDFFKPEDLAQQYNLHQEANKIDLAAMTDEIVLSKDNQGLLGEGNRVQIETDSLHHAGIPGQISQQQGTKV